jgi:hypothetical protein
MAQESLVSLIHPQEFSRVVENAMYVFKDQNHDKIPDLLQDAGNLLVKASKRLTPTQLVLAIAAVAIATVFVVSKIEGEIDFHRDAA